MSHSPIHRKLRCVRSIPSYSSFMRYLVFKIIPPYKLGESEVGGRMIMVGRMKKGKVFSPLWALT